MGLAGFDEWSISSGGIGVVVGRSVNFPFFRMSAQLQVAPSVNSSARVD